MKKEDIKSILKLLLAIGLIIIAFKFFIYLLPFILVVILVYFVYDLFIRTRNKTVDKVGKANYDNSNRKSKKGHRVQEAEIVREKTEETSNR